MTEEQALAVAGLLTANDASPVARILDGMLGAVFPFVLSEALLAEYRSVLVRPKLRKLHGLTVAEVEVILIDLAQHAIVLAPVAAPPAPDPGDQLLWDLLAARADLLLLRGSSNVRSIHSCSSALRRAGTRSSRASSCPWASARLSAPCRTMRESPRAFLRKRSDHIIGAPNRMASYLSKL